MPDIQYGWKCPGCDTIYAPWQETCEKCSTVTRTVISGYSGTAVLSGAFSGCGTAFYAPPKTMAVQAQEIVSDWRAKGFSAKALISAAVDTLIDKEDDETWTWQPCDRFPLQSERGAEAEEYTIIGLATSDDPDAIGIGLFVRTGPTRIAGANTREEAETVAARMRQQPNVFFVAITRTLRVWKAE